MHCRCTKPDKTCQEQRTPEEEDCDVDSEPDEITTESAETEVLDVKQEDALEEQVETISKISLTKAPTQFTSTPPPLTNSDLVRRSKVH